MSRTPEQVRSDAKARTQAARKRTAAVLVEVLAMLFDAAKGKPPSATLSVNIQDGSDTGAIVRPIPLVTKTLSVEFLPEGGDMIDGVAGRVYFMVRTPIGKPADLKGVPIGIGALHGGAGAAHAGQHIQAVLERQAQIEHGGGVGAAAQLALGGFAVAHPVDQEAELAQALEMKAEHKVEIRTPQRGEKRGIVEQAALNAREHHVELFLAHVGDLVSGHLPRHSTASADRATQGDIAAQLTERFDPRHYRIAMDEALQRAWRDLEVAGPTAGGSPADARRRSDHRHRTARFGRSWARSHGRGDADRGFGRQRGRRQPR